MTVFYWVMGLAIAGTLAPSALYLLLYMATGEPACEQRAQLGRMREGDAPSVDVRPCINELATASRH